MKKKTALWLGAFAVCAVIFGEYVLNGDAGGEKTLPAAPAVPAALAPDWTAHYDDARDMAETVPVIVVGKAVSAEIEVRGDMVFTFHEIQIEKNLKNSSGGAPLDTVTVMQTGGSKDGITTKPFADAPLLEPGKTYLLFLDQTEEGHFLIAGGYQGMAEIGEDCEVMFVNE